MDLKLAEEICQNFMKTVCEKDGKAPDELNTFDAPASKQTVREEGIV